MLGALLLSMPATRLSTQANLDDRRVIQTALLYIYRDNFGLSKGEPVGLNAQLNSKKRPDYNALLDREIKFAKEDIKAWPSFTSNHPPANQSELDHLRALRSGNSGPARYVPPAVQPLRAYSWGRHVLIADHWVTLRNAQHRREVCGVAIVKLPAFSLDGNSCILDLSMPWLDGWRGMQTDFTFIMTRRDGGWKIVYTTRWNPL